MDIIKLFNSVVTISFMGSVLVLIILIMKSVFRKKLNSYFHYYIWILLLVRLVMPYSVQTSFSIHNTLNSAFKASNGTYSINNVMPTDDLLYNYSENMSASSEIPEYNIKKDAGSAMIKSNKYSPGNIMGIIWLSGSSIMILLVACSHYRIRYIIKNSIDYPNHLFYNILENCMNTINISSKVRLIYTNKITSPSLYGIINPVIIIPLKIAKNIDSDEFRYILLHELSHLKRKDVFLNWIATLLQCIYWFNPIVLFGLYKMKQDCELACDQHVISYLNGNENLSYGNTLIRMLEASNDRQWIPGAASLSKNKFELKRRISMIANYKKLSISGVVLGAVIAAFIGLIGLTNSIAKADVSDKIDAPIVIYNSHILETYNFSAKITDVSEELSKSLQKHGIDSMYLSPEPNNYNPQSSYTYSRTLIQNNVFGYDKKILLDIHRDGALEDADENLNKTIKIVLGSDNPKFQENKRFADLLAKEINNTSIIKASITEFKGAAFNQDLSNNSLMIEIGNQKSSEKDIKACEDSLAKALVNIVK